MSADFSKNTRLLRSMKSDLDYIFQKLRFVIRFRSSSDCILVELLALCIRTTHVIGEMGDFVIQFLLGIL